MRQVPAMLLPNGELMTESAAILIWLADSHPEARLAPTMAAHARPAFLRWMAFVSSAIYALYWIRDEPRRIIDDRRWGRWRRTGCAAASTTAGRSWTARSTPAATSWATT